jgi:type I restriction enzyme S subunit
MSLDVRSDHLAWIQAILRRCVPTAIVWAFGSRAQGTARATSDLDLCVDNHQSLSFETLAALRDAFAESNLPYKVDVVDWHSVDPAFQALIQSKRVVIQGSITPSQERQTR